MMTRRNNVVMRESNDNIDHKTCLCIFKIYTLFGQIKNKFTCFVHFTLVYQIMLSFTP